MRLLGETGGELSGLIWGESIRLKDSNERLFSFPMEFVLE